MKNSRSYHFKFIIAFHDLVIFTYPRPHTNLQTTGTKFLMFVSCNLLYYILHLHLYITFIKCIFNSFLSTETCRMHMYVCVCDYVCMDSFIKISQDITTCCSHFFRFYMLFKFPSTYSLVLVLETTHVESVYFIVNHTPA